MIRPLLITAGATRNFIDDMRCITANASGKTGAQLAQAFPTQCTLFGSPSALLELAFRTKTDIAEHPTIQTQEFTSTEDLHQQMKQWVLQNRHGIIVHTAAVGDYAPTEKSGKIPSGQQELTLTLHPTIKILDQIKKWAPSCLLISFKAAPPKTEPQALTTIAAKQRQRSKSDLVFANVLTQTGSHVQLVSQDETLHFSKRADGINALVKWIAQQRSIGLDL